MSELQGKVALVTGGGRGIGRAVVQRLAAMGADLVINDVDRAPAEEAVADVIKLGRRAITAVGSISRPEFGDDFVARALDEYGRVDIVINNAGYATYAPTIETTDENFELVVDVLVSAPFRILRAAGRYFTRAAADAPPGDRPPVRKVVNISSIGGIMGAPNQVAYAVGKAGILGLTNTLAFEWGHLNVHVNAVAPGLTRTRLTEGPDVGVNSITIEGREHRLTGGSWPPENRTPLDSMTQMVPLGRIGDPTDIAGAVGFLSSPASDFMTGQTLIVDGGMRIGR